MFNKEQGLKELEKVFKGEIEFLTIQGIAALLPNRVLEELNEVYTTNVIKDKNLEEPDIELAKKMEFRPNLVKEHMNDSWIRYSVIVRRNMYYVGYVNRGEKKVIINTTIGESVLFEVTRYFPYSYSSRVRVSDVDFDKLNDFSVTSIKKIKQDYNDMTTRSINRFFEENKAQLLTLVDDAIERTAKNHLLSLFINKREFSRPKYHELVKSYECVENKIMSEESLLSDGVLVEFATNKDFFELIYMELLHKNFFGEAEDLYFEKALQALYEEEFSKTIFEKFDKDYRALLIREIVGALLECGKTMVVKVSDEPFELTRDNYHTVSNDGELKIRGIKDYNKIEQISFRKKTLFNKAEFDEKYGHLKSTI